MLRMSETWKEKYGEGRDEIASFIRSASNLLADMNFLLQYGVWRLNLGMRCFKYVDKKPSFDATAKKEPYPYDEKNLYVNASNRLWHASMWHSYSQINEIYYDALLRKIKEFKERNEDFDFNKGIVYANLGVAQSAQMKLDEGFANILKALYDDSLYSEKTPDDNLRESGLFTQFEDAYVKNSLGRIILQLNITEISSIKEFVDVFLDCLNNDQRTFFDFTFAKIIKSWEIWNEKANRFTANRLLAYTQDFCLFNEDLLKSKVVLKFHVPRKGYWTLSDLIPKMRDLVPKPNEFQSINISGCKANTMKNLNLLLPSELSKDQPEKCLRILLILRNYSSHNVEGGDSTDYFYEHFDEILKELVRATCKITLLPKPSAS